MTRHRAPRAILSSVRGLITLGVAAVMVLGLGGCESAITQRTPSSPAPASPANPSPQGDSTTRGAAAATRWTMPNLVGAGLQDAQDRIQSLTDFAISITTSHDATGHGRRQIMDRNWKVCSQNIPAGSTIERSARIDFGAVKIEERCP